MFTISNISKFAVVGSVLATTLGSVAFAGQYPMDPEDVRRAREVNRPSVYAGVHMSKRDDVLCKDSRSVVEKRKNGCNSQGASLIDGMVGTSQGTTVTQYPGLDTVYSVQDGGYVRKEYGRRD